MVKIENNNEPIVPPAKVKEPIKVNEKELTMKATVEIPKVAVGLKVPTKDLELKDFELDLYLSMLSTILFGSSSAFKERVRESKIVNSIYTEWEKIEDFRTFYLTASTIDPDQFIKEVKKELSDHKVTEKDFNRIKKVWIASEVRMIDNIKAMKLKKLQDLIEKIDFTNISTVKMVQKKK